MARGACRAGPAARVLGNGDGVAEAGADQLAGEHLVGPPRRKLPSLAQEQGMGGARRQLLEVMGDEDDSELRIAIAKLGQAREQLLAPGYVEPGRRFVKQQDPRAAHQGAGDQRAASLALREHVPAAPRQPAETHELDDIVRPGRIRRCRSPARRPFQRAGRASEHKFPQCPGGPDRVMRADQAEQRPKREDVHLPKPLAENL